MHCPSSRAAPARPARVPRVRPETQAGERLLLADRPDPARRALAARLVAEEGRDPHQHLARGRRSRRTRRPRPSRASRSRRATSSKVSGRSRSSGPTNTPAAPPSSTACSCCRRDPARALDQVAERLAERDLVDARPLDVPGEAEQLRPGRVLVPISCGSSASVRYISEVSAYAGPPWASTGRMLISVSTLLTTVGLPNTPTCHRERRLGPRLAAEALDRVEDRGLLAADVGAGAAADLDVEREPVVEDVLTQVAVVAGGLDRVAAGARCDSGYSPRR